MQLTEERRALLLAYCRLDREDLSDEDGLLLDEFYAAAVDYMEDAGVGIPSDKGRLAKFDLVVNAMVLNAWDHRDLTEVATAAENPAVRRMINQLKQSEPVTE